MFLTKDLFKRSYDITIEDTSVDAMQAIIADCVVFANTSDRILEEKLLHLSEKQHELKTGLYFKHTSKIAEFTIHLEAEEETLEDGEENKYKLSIIFKEFNQ